MRTIVTLSLAVFVLFAACKRAENQTAQTPKSEPKKVEAVQKIPMDQLPKWPADYPVTGDSVAVISVSIDNQPVGEMVAEFYGDKAPNHVRNFKWIAEHGSYDGVKVHRIIKGFMIQSGDPRGDGSGGPNWRVNAEFSDIPHTRGILSMARSSDPNSAGSQFFVVDGAPSHLNGQYTVFGKVFKGLDVLDKIVNVPVGPSARNENSVPQKPVVMTSVRIVPRSAVMN
jgi:cyclophilin family peptidyl-prolyl cis-trans isomerase